MKLIKKERFAKDTFTFGSNCEYWDLGNGFVVDIESYDHDANNIWICLHNEKDSRILSSAERCTKDEIFARKIQNRIDNIKIDYGIDAVLYDLF